MLTIKNLSKSFNEGTENEVNIFCYYFYWI